MIDLQKIYKQRQLRNQQTMTSANSISSSMEETSVGHLEEVAVAVHQVIHHPPPPSYEELDVKQFLANMSSQPPPTYNEAIARRHVQCGSHHSAIHTLGRVYTLDTVME